MGLDINKKENKIIKIFLIKIASPLKLVFTYFIKFIQETEHFLVVINSCKRIKPMIKLLIVLENNYKFWWKKYKGLNFRIKEI